MPYFYGIDSLYIILVLPAILLSLFAQMKVSSTFGKYNSVRNHRNITGFDVARRILDRNGLNYIPIERTRGNLTDHYDPKKKVLRLSDSVFSSTSIAALGVAAHECGHAIQHAYGYTPLKIRHAVFPVVRISSTLAVPLIILGFVLATTNLVYVGIVLFAAVVLFQLITLPVEFDASRRALAILSCENYLYEDEMKGARKVLSAAALTYVASALTSLMQLLRFIIIANNRRR
ncbi:MAG: zinc metallopeptidase [Clostridia bacterium]|nr:zinc metallopeptidase [Clostridia bacterium]